MMMYSMILRLSLNWLTVKFSIMCLVASGELVR